MVGVVGENCGPCEDGNCAEQTNLLFHGPRSSQQRLGTSCELSGSDLRIQGCVWAESRGELPRVMRVWTLTVRRGFIGDVTVRALKRIETFKAFFVL